MSEQTRKQIEMLCCYLNTQAQKIDLDTFLVVNCDCIKLQDSPYDLSGSEAIAFMIGLLEGGES